MKLNPYLMFEDQCEAAFTLYAQVLGGKIDALMRFSEMPASENFEVPPQYRQRVLHAQLTVQGQVLMGSDSPPQYPHGGVKGMAVTLNFESAAEAERVFKALSEGGSVQMPFGETFWAERFGMATDRFGTPWMINYTGSKG